MDLSQPISFNGITAQPIAITPGEPCSGLTITTVDFAPIPVDMSVDKLAQSDGAAVSDAWLSARPIGITGAAWGTSPGDCWDQVDKWMAAFSPRSPTLNVTSNLTFLQPTAKIATWPVSAYPNGIPLYLTAAPHREPWHDTVLKRDAATGAHTLPTYAQLVAAEPYKYLNAAVVQQDITTATVPLTTYRGNAPSMKYAYIWIAVHSTGPSNLNVVVNGAQPIGTSNLTLNLSGLTLNQTYLLSFANKTVSLAGVVLPGVISNASIFGAITPGATIGAFAYVGSWSAITTLKLQYREAFF